MFYNSMSYIRKSLRSQSLKKLNQNSRTNYSSDFNKISSSAFYTPKSPLKMKYNGYNKDLIDIKKKKKPKKKIIIEEEPEEEEKQVIFEKLNDMQSFHQK